VVVVHSAGYLTISTVMNLVAIFNEFPFEDKDL
jgi:hypothetical protein